MPKGPKGEKRPADAIGNAVKVMRIAVGDEDEQTNSGSKSRSNVGSIGGKARSQKLTPTRRSEIAKKAARTRWGVRPVPSEEVDS